VSELNWYPFDPEKGSRQKRPPVKKYVLVQGRHKERREDGTSPYPDPIMVGYRKNAAGDKQSPYFVTPGGSCFTPYGVYRWCDCLPENFSWPNGGAE